MFSKLDSIYLENCLCSSSTISTVLFFKQITDGTEFAVDSLTSFLEQCLSAITRVTDFWVDGEPDPTYSDLICLNNCNEHGNCSEGMVINERSESNTSILLSAIIRVSD